MKTNPDICLKKCEWKRFTNPWHGWTTVMCVRTDTPNINNSNNRLIGDIYQSNPLEYNYNFTRPTTCPYELEHILFENAIQHP